MLEAYFLFPRWLHSPLLNAGPSGLLLLIFTYVFCSPILFYFILFSKTFLFFFKMPPPQRYIILFSSSSSPFRLLCHFYIATNGGLLLVNFICHFKWTAPLSLSCLSFVLCPNGTECPLVSIRLLLTCSSISAYIKRGGSLFSYGEMATSLCVEILFV